MQESLFHPVMPAQAGIQSSENRMDSRRSLSRSMRGGNDGGRRVKFYATLGLSHLNPVFMTCMLRSSQMKTVTVTCNVRKDPEWGIANG
jgi:hypothetical protein